ncbi:MAG: hypothetical protein N2V77_02085 [Canidatus Methanoxibalbensis ujae]|nr:hypothetical protein [Candidatus Methanoxibalbensis ujae]MCW7077756.1 hypothetical protein [Candidatus Methanoxibalbensis ujae]
MLNGVRKFVIFSSIGGICVALALSLIISRHEEPFLGFHAIIGAVGVLFFAFAMRILSLAQREGRQDE